MYIVKTFKIDIPIDFDEMKILMENAGQKDKLIFFRRGAVNPAHIVAVVDDEERRSEIRKLPGDTDEDLEKRMREERSEDIFARFRNTSALGSGINNLQLS